MKLRQIPEDFIVEEISDFEIEDKGNYKIYLLKKKGIESFSLFGYLAKRNNIPLTDIGFAGLKDKHALTIQYFSIPAKYDIKTKEEENFKIEFLGFINSPIKSGDLEANRFEITVRAIRKGEIEGIYQKAKTVPSIGVPNYFDSQRFGSVSNNQFIAKLIIKKDYENALKFYLTSPRRFDNQQLKRFKEEMLRNWGKFNFKVNKSLAKRIIERYKRTDSWLQAYKAVQPKLREMFVSTYQSYLWNECAKKMIRKIVNKKYVYDIPYSIGSLAFYKSLDNEEKRKISVGLNTISENLKTQGIEKDIVEEVLKKEGLSLKDFDIKKETGNFFLSRERKLIIHPLNFKIEKPAIDELNDKNRNSFFKVVLSFDLPKGSYATIITKRIFNR